MIGHIIESEKIIGIAGGSGSGKSSLAISLCKKYPNECALLHIDDYFKKREEVPKFERFSAFDHPDAVRFGDLCRDLLRLHDGKPVSILTKSELYNPGYRKELKNHINYMVESKPVVILEGFLALYDRRIRSLMDIKIYLDMPIEESTKRRSENKFNLEEEYFRKVLSPMHKEFAEPTKAFADLVIDATNKSKEEVFKIVEKRIFGSRTSEKVGKASKP